MRSGPSFDAVVIGGGTMGSALGVVLAAAGNSVTIIEHDSGARSLCRQRCTDVATAWLDERHAQESLDAIRVVSSDPDALAAATIIIEAINEELAAKQQLLQAIDRIAAPDALLCTNTSALPIREVTSLVALGDRVIGTHWFNPPHLVPAVEVIPAPGTSARTVERVSAILVGLAKDPIMVPDSPGFVINRLQMALAKEAMACVDEGLIAPADLDRLVVSSLGLRLAVDGPLAIADFAGLDVYGKVFETLQRTVGERFRMPAALERLVEQEQFGVKTGSGFRSYDGVDAGAIARRDRRLLALSRLTKSEAWQDGGS